jgi:hypothetical protein
MTWVYVVGDVLVLAVVALMIVVSAYDMWDRR